MTWQQFAKRMGNEAGTYPIKQIFCLMAGPAKATQQIMYFTQKTENKTSCKGTNAAAVWQMLSLIYSTYMEIA